MSRLREINPQEAMATGEFVWQGALGYCVLREPASREEKKDVEVVLIQTGTSERETRVLRSDLLNPVRGLADSQPVPEEKKMQSFVEFLRSLSCGVPKEE